MNEIVAAIYSRLDDQLSYSVFDSAPQDQDLPYVQFHAWSLDDWDSDTELGFNGTLDIVAHSDYRGSKEVIEMSDAIYTALNRYEVPDTATYGLVTVHREFFSVVDDGETRQGLNRYRIIFGDLP